MLIYVMNSAETFAQFLTVLFIFVLVLAITYFVTRYIGRLQKTTTSGDNIEVIEAVRISQGAFIEIVRVGDKLMALAISKDNVTYLCDVEKDSLVERPDGMNTSIDFAGILKRFKEERGERHE